MSSGCTGLRLPKDASDGSDVDAAAASVPGLTVSWVYWLKSVSQNQGDNSRCDVAYRKLCFYHRLVDGPTYTQNANDQLVELHCSIFLQQFLTFSIHHLSNLMHHSHVCFCYKSNIFPRNIFKTVWMWWTASHQNKYFNHKQNTATNSQKWK